MCDALPEEDKGATVLQLLDALGADEKCKSSFNDEEKEIKANINFGFFARGSAKYREPCVCFG